MNENEEITLSDSLERIKDAVDDIRTATGETGTIEEVADAVEALAEGSYNTYKAETYSEMQEIENPQDGDVCYVSKRSLISAISTAAPGGGRDANSFNKLIFPYSVDFSEPMGDDFGFELAITSTVLEDVDMVDESSEVFGEYRNEGEPEWVVDFRLILDQSKLPEYSSSTVKAMYYVHYKSSDGQHFTIENACISTDDVIEHGIPFAEVSAHKDIEITFPCIIHMEQIGSGLYDWEIEQFFRTYDYAPLSLNEYSANIVLERIPSNFYTYNPQETLYLDVCVNDYTRSFLQSMDVVWPYYIICNDISGEGTNIELDMQLPTMDIMNKPYITSPHFVYHSESGDGHYVLQQFLAGSKYIANPVYPSSNPADNGITEISYTGNTLGEYGFEEAYLNLPYAICIKEPLPETGRPSGGAALAKIINTQYDGTVYVYKYNGTKNEWEFINAEY